MTESAAVRPLLPDAPYPPAQRPTMYFIGVTTLKSSIMQVFPNWAEYLGLKDVLIRGMNFAWHDQPERYRRAVAFIREDPLSLGDLVTTHKMDLLTACRDQFDRLDEFFMTKGHYHTVLQTGEVYLCLRGQGLMLMKLADGRCCWEPFSPGQLVYVPPYWAHRSVNTGDEPLISLCLYPGDAGHNYGDIQTDGFPRRVFLRQDQVVVE